MDAAFFVFPSSWPFLEETRKFVSSVTLKEFEECLETPVIAGCTFSFLVIHPLLPQQCFCSVTSKEGPDIRF